MYRWNLKVADEPSDKEIVQNPGAYKSFVVEAALCRTVLAIMEWIETNELHKATLATPTRSSKKNKTN